MSKISLLPCFLVLMACGAATEPVDADGGAPRDAGPDDAGEDAEEDAGEDAGPGEDAGEDAATPPPDRFWRTEQLIPTEHDVAARWRSAEQPALGIDAEGNAIVAWSHNSDVSANLWATRYDAATRTWGAARLLETDDGGDAVMARVAMAPNGDAIVVWSQSDASRSYSSPFANRYDARTDTWSGAELLADDGVSSARRLNIRMDSRGNALVAWVYNPGTIDEDVSRETPWVIHYDAETETWFGLQSLDPEESIMANLLVDMNDDGDAIVTWEEHDPPASPAHFASHRDGSSGAWSSPRRMLPDLDRRHAAMAMAATGDTIVVWTDFADSAWQWHWVRYTADTDSWGPPERFASDEVLSEWSLGSDRLGNAMLVRWNGRDIVALRYDASTSTWGEERTVAPEPDTTRRLPPAGTAVSVCMNDVGDAMAVWGSGIVSQGESMHVGASRYDRVLGRWSAPETIDGMEVGLTRRAAVALGPNGDAVAAWTRVDGMRNTTSVNNYR